MTTDAAVAKVSIVGSGIGNAPGYAAKMFGALADAGVNIEMISTSEIRITCIIGEDQVEEAARALHGAFHLEMPDTGDSGLRGRVAAGHGTVGAASAPRDGTRSAARHSPRDIAREIDQIETTVRPWTSRRGPCRERFGRIGDWYPRFDAGCRSRRLPVARAAGIGARHGARRPIGGISRLPGARIVPSGTRRCELVRHRVPGIVGA